MVRPRPRCEGARRRDRRRPRREATSRGGLHGRHRRPGAGHATGCRLSRRRAAVRGRELRCRHLQDRRPPLPGHSRGGRGDGACHASPRRDRGQRLRRRARRGSRAPSRPDARALLLGGRVEADDHGGRPRGRAARTLRTSSGGRGLARAGRHADEGRRARPRAARGSRARRCAHPEVDRRQGPEKPEIVAIIVDNGTRLVVQGLTGSEGRFHGLRNRKYGTQVVAGVTPGKAGQDVEGIPVFNTVADAVQETGANTTLIFVPARFATDAIYEAVDAGIGTVICITEHIPAHDMLAVYTFIRGKGVTMIGPNCPGVLSPGKANVGIIPAEIFTEGSIGLVSRSGTLTYQIGHELTQLGLGNSTIVGIGGDPVVGSSFIDVLEKFEADPQTELIVLVGEIGGDEEEKAAVFVAEHVTKPVLAYIAGFSAPPGKTMGHAGAIISGSAGTAQAKKEALEAVDIEVGTTPTEVAQLVAERVA